jgi:hypothetical protein
VFACSQKMRGFLGPCGAPPSMPGPEVRAAEGDWSTSHGLKAAPASAPS